MSEYGSSPTFALEKENGVNNVHKTIKQTQEKKKLSMNATLPRAGNNHRYSCNSRYAPAHVRFNIKKKLIIYFNTLKPYR